MGLLLVVYKMNQDGIINTIFPVVIKTINDLRNQYDIPFIIKGGASIKYHLLYDRGIDVPNLTYDIDIVPLLLTDPYVNIEARSAELNEILYQELLFELETNFGSQVRINSRNDRGLMTIQINNYDVIDISYIDPSDPDPLLFEPSITSMVPMKLFCKMLMRSVLRFN